MANIGPIEVEVEFSDSASRWCRRMEFVIGGSLGVSLASLAFAIYAAFWR